MTKKIKLLALGALLAAPLCYVGAKHVTRAHASETAPPTKIEPLEAQTLRGDLLEFGAAAGPFFAALKKIQKAEDKYHVRLQDITHPGPLDTIDFATGEIHRQPSAPAQAVSK